VSISVLLYRSFYRIYRTRNLNIVKKTEKIIIKFSVFLTIKLHDESKHVIYCLPIMERLTHKNYFYSKKLYLLKKIR